LKASSADLLSLSLSETAVTGGTSLVGTVTLTEAAPAGGAEVALSSSNQWNAAVPASVVVPEGETSATFAVNTSAVSFPSNVMIAAIYEGVAAYAMLAINPATTVDTVTISKAQYVVRKRLLKVEAASTSGTATLTVHDQASGVYIGTLSRNRKNGRYTGQFSWPNDPVTISVQSSHGGSATAPTTR
jgi:hypothetical protein